MSQEQKFQIIKIEKDIEEQRQKIAEIEDQIKRVDDEKNKLLTENNIFEVKSNLIDKEVDEESQKWVVYIGNREILKNREVTYSEKLKEYS